MKEHPKLFIGEMVRAIRDGSKTQTRLPVTFHNSVTGVGLPRKHWDRLVFNEAWIDTEYLHVPVKDVGDGYHSGGVVYRVYPRYDVGDHLWVRETHFKSLKTGLVYYKEGMMSYEFEVHGPLKWTPSMHMKREHSRINLEVTRRWPERVQGISGMDAVAEGCEQQFGGYKKACQEFAILWDSCYGQGAWKQNGYVWAYEFKVI